MRSGSHLLILILLLVAPLSFAADKETPREFSFTTGPLLPNQIEGMTEIMPSWGVRYKPLDWVSEFGLLNANREEVNYNSLYVSFRGEIPMQGFMTMIYTGLDMHHYRFPGSGFRTVFGGHVGGGMLAFIGDRVWFRSEMKFNLNPGTAMYIGFGFNFMLSAPGK